MVQVLVPGHFGPLYAGVDGIHAASMVVLAVRDPQRRRAVLLSAAVAAVSGLSAARATAVRRRNR
ncbi:hypothetical protein FHX74_000502 [Friedmanniella endophytica]|uniref:Uncharacterized protein n=1 Tax=Microlunatus kandeliicorticis TaxID=1759536 RepID=A0A7W3IPM3_9ACTN|nr:hypothetical protein [Microlunatus kandeliicorticis]MBA8792908.1 hypothetical protein [Microlunatus kandeliicorticis]